MLGFYLPSTCIDREVTEFCSVHFKPPSFSGWVQSPVAAMTWTITHILLFRSSLIPIPDFTGQRDVSFWMLDKVLSFPHFTSTHGLWFKISTSDFPSFLIHLENEPWPHWVWAFLELWPCHLYPSRWPEEMVEEGRAGKKALASQPLSNYPQVPKCLWAQTGLGKKNVTAPPSHCLPCVLLALLKRRLEFSWKAREGKYNWTILANLCNRRHRRTPQTCKVPSRLFEVSLVFELNTVCKRHSVVTGTIVNLRIKGNLLRYLCIPG